MSFDKVETLLPHMGVTFMNEVLRATNGEQGPCLTRFRVSSHYYLSLYTSGQLDTFALFSSTSSLLANRLSTLSGGLTQTHWISKPTCVLSISASFSTPYHLLSFFLCLINHLVQNLTHSFVFDKND